MKKLLSTLSAIGLLALGGSVQAATLTTAPASADSTNKLFCTIVNIGATTQSVTLAIKDNSGGTVGTSVTTPLGPGATTSIFDDTTGAYCVFTVPGSAKKFRAAAVYSDITNFTMAIPAQ